MVEDKGSVDLVLYIIYIFLHIHWSFLQTYTYTHVHDEGSSSLFGPPSYQVSHAGHCTGGLLSSLLILYSIEIYNFFFPCLDRVTFKIYLIELWTLVVFVIGNGGEERKYVGKRNKYISRQFIAAFGVNYFVISIFIHCLYHNHHLDTIFNL